MTPQSMRNISVKRKNDTEVDRMLTTMATDKILASYKKNKNVPLRKDVEHVVREQTNKGKYGLTLNNIDEKNVNHFNELRERFQVDKSQVNPNRLRSHIRRILRKKCVTRKLQLSGSGLFRVSNLIDFLLHNAVKTIFSHNSKTVSTLKRQQRLLQKSVGTIVLNEAKIVYLQPSDISQCARQEPSFKKLLNLTL
jgi:hypothetical protein